MRLRHARGSALAPRRVPFVNEFIEPFKRVEATELSLLATRSHASAARMAGAILNSHDPLTVRVGSSFLCSAAPQRLQKSPRVLF